MFHKFPNFPPPPPDPGVVYKMIMVGNEEQIEKRVASYTEVGKLGRNDEQNEEALMGRNDEQNEYYMGGGGGKRMGKGTVFGGNGLFNISRFFSYLY